MNYSTIEVRPISGSIGAEIHGVDLSKDLGQETFAEIHQAFLDHLVIFFRDQHLTVDQHIAFARRFGPLSVDPFVKSPEDRPELLVVVRE
jgi:taurine dioxygenase